jgi:hypothetical protein
MTVIPRWALAAAMAACCVGAPVLAEAAPRTNILFIAIDDLRPELGCYRVTASDAERDTRGGVGT